MRASVWLGRIAGIRVGINLSVFVIVAILVIGLAAGRLPLAYPDRSGLAYVGSAVVAALLFLASLLAHEMAHSLVARRHGIEVESIVLWLLGGVASLRGEPKTPAADFRIAIAGPLTSLALAGLFTLVAAGLNLLGAEGLPLGVLTYLAVTNLMLGLFNLLPAAPLDGGRILRAALWRSRGNRSGAAVSAARVGRVLGFLLIALGVLQLVSGAGIGGIWMALIGWFVVSAASAEEQHARVSGRLSGLTVAHVMTPQPLALDGNLTVEQFVHQVVMTHRFSTYPLVDPDGRLVGLVTLNRARAVPPDQHRTTRLRDIACPPAEVPVGRPEQPVQELLERMHGCADGRAVVVDAEGRVIGVVSPTDLARALELADLRRLDPYPAPSGADVTSLSTLPESDPGPDRRPR
ncbi:MAG TPA: site-2 protease family protein [Propionibacteriaceae bacterium]|jgi:Zn-dependent protease|nr:site-2 protease family protein [Propionibacteriaceae bacterium]